MSDDGVTGRRASKEDSARETTLDRVAGPVKTVSGLVIAFFTVLTLIKDWRPWSTFLVIVVAVASFYLATRWWVGSRRRRGIWRIAPFASACIPLISLIVVSAVPASRPWASALAGMPTPTLTPEQSQTLKPVKTNRFVRLMLVVGNAGRGTVTASRVHLIWDGRLACFAGGVEEYRISESVHVSHGETSSSLVGSVSHNQLTIDSDPVPKSEPGSFAEELTGTQRSDCNTGHITTEVSFPVTVRMGPGSTPILVDIPNGWPTPDSDSPNEAVVDFTNGTSVTFCQGTKCE